MISFLIKHLDRNFKIKLDFVSKDTFTFVDRKSMVKRISVNADTIFRPEMQSLFSRAEKVGIVKKLINLERGKTQDLVMVLTNAGIILFELIRVKI